MRQLALQIQSDPAPSLDNFVGGRNAEALAALYSAVRAPSRETLIYLWGPDGSGKTHLLVSLAQALAAAGRRCETHDALLLDESDRLDGQELLIDNVDALSPAQAERLFHAWNRIREDGGLLVCAGRQAPSALPLAPELATRLAWGAVFRLYPLDDAEKFAALRARADAQAIPVVDEALHYLLSRGRRDLPSLLRALAQLDELSLATHRAITIPLVRELLQNQTRDNSLEPLCD